MHTIDSLRRDALRLKLLKSLIPGTPVFPPVEPLTPVVPPKQETIIGCQCHLMLGVCDWCKEW